MKTIILICFSVILLAGCCQIHDKTGNQSITEKSYMEQLKMNKEIALNLSKSIMNGDWEQVDKLLADDFVYEADGR